MPGTNVRDWDEETLWRTYSTLTDVEAVFRSLKSELGLRPIFHQTPKRVTCLSYRPCIPGYLSEPYAPYVKRLDRKMRRNVVTTH